MGYHRFDEKSLGEINNAYEKALSTTTNNNECTPIFTNHIHAKKVVIDDNDLEEIADGEEVLLDQDGDTNSDEYNDSEY